MTFKRMLRFASAALLLAVGSSVYTVAEAQVTLKDGKTTLSWAKFAEAVNNPSSISGTADSTALQNARVAYLTTAVGNQTAAFNALTAAKKTYNDAEADLKAWQNDLTNLQNERTALANSLAEYRSLKTDSTNKVNSYKTDLALVNSELNALPKEPNVVTKTWLKTILDAANAFKTAYDNDDDNVAVWYKIEDGKKGVIVSIAFTKPADTNGWTEGNQTGLYNLWAGKASDYVNFVKVYLGSDYKTATTTETSVGSEYYSVESFRGKNIYVVADAVSAVKTLSVDSKFSTTTYVISQQYKETAEGYQKTITSLNKLIANANAKIAEYTVIIDGTKATDGSMTGGLVAQVADKDDAIQRKNTQIKNYTDSQQAEYAANVQTAQEAYDKAVAEVATKKAAFESALAAYKEAVATASAAALDNYKTVHLNADVTVAAAELISNFDGVIIGNGHVISLGADATSVFNNFTGTLSNAAVNGKFAASVAGAKFSNVASWNGAGAYYNEAGTKTDNIGTISQLGYLVRDNFGVDFSGKLVAKASAISPVYKLTVYNVNSTPVVYVQKANEVLTQEGGQEFKLEPNTFAKSETRDLKGFANIFFDDNTCESVVITDKNAFFCPVDLRATKVSYDRNFAAGKQAVCLPFELSSSTFGSDNVEYLCRYDKEDEDRFWFKKIGGAIPAYTPTLIHVKAGFTMADLANVTIKATPASQITEDDGDTTDPSKGYGMLKKATRDEFNGVEYGYSIFGLTTSGTFKRAADGVALPALRLVVSSKYGQKTVNGAPAKSLGSDEKGIGILEEDGTTAVEDIASNAPAVTVVGGQNEIIFTAEADYTKVGVYSIDGRLAAMADIKAGTTSVNVPSGLYIVMGKKVLVK